MFVQPYERMSPVHTKYIQGNDCWKRHSTSHEHGPKLTEDASSIDSDHTWINHISKDWDISPDMEKIYVTSEASQVELVASPFLQECLHIIKTEPEFRDLSYRASHDVNGGELLIIYRDRVIRALTIPVEPISLTLEPNGKCLLSIPFKPALPVMVTKPQTNAVDRNALMALLQMVSGKGYAFCPGLPAKLLYGKACGKYVVLHRIPFKRYNAQGCPVYFQSQSLKAAPNKHDLRALCPRCMQVSRWVQSLPFMRSVTPVATPPSLAGPKMPLVDTTKQQNMKSPAVSVDSTSFDCMIVGSEKPETRLLTLDTVSQRTTPTSPASSVGLAAPQVQQNLPDLKTPGRRSYEPNSGNANAVRLQSVSDSLRQLLHARTRSKQALSSPVDGNSKDLESANEETKGKNVCKLCHKQFSSNLRLSKHVQRHEGSMRNVKPQGRRSISTKSSDAMLLRAFRWSRSLAKNGKKGHADISFTSLRLLLKNVDSLVRKEVSEQSLYNDDRRRRKKRKYKANDEEGSNATKGQASKVPMVIETKSDRLESEKSEIGLSALLIAASMASNQSQSVSVPSAHAYSSSFSLPFVVDREVGNDVSSTVDDESPGATKRARKSQRLASKRAKTGTKTSTSSKEALAEGNTPSHVDHPIDDSFTNLNLLSTVSLQTGPVPFSKPMINISTTSNSPTSRASQTSTLSFSTSSSAVSSLKTKMNISAKVLPSSSLPQLVKVSMEDKLSNIPSMAVMSSEEQVSSNPKPKIPPLIFGFGSVPLVSSPTGTTIAGGCIDHNIPLHVLDKDLSTPSTASETSSHADNSKQHKLDCGAIDLSKRKVSSCKVLGVSYREENPSPGAESSKSAADVIRRLLMINSLPGKEPIVPAVSKEPPSPRALVSNKEADESLQARIFASAKNFKTDGYKQASGQVQTVVAPFSGSSSNHKQGKPLSTEIQCGYKWSGSGGLVKERTHLVRELVPSNMIVDLLGKADGEPNLTEDCSISATVTGIAKLKSPFGSASGRLYQASGHLSASPPLTKSLKLPVQLPSQNPMPPCALNLSKSRLESETHGKLSVLPSTLLSSVMPASGTSIRPHRVPVTAATSRSVLQTSALQTSFRHLSGPFERLPASPSQSSRDDGNSAIPAKVISLPLSVRPASPVSLAPGSTSPGPHSISSPSLAAILRQPPNPRIGQNNVGNQNGQPSSSAASGRTVGQERIQIKREPSDPESYVGEPALNNLPYSPQIKIEGPETSSKVYGSDFVSANANLSFNIADVVSSVSSVSSNFNQSVPPSTLKVRLGVRPTVAKCELCSQPFSSSRDSSSHVCAGLST